MRREHEPWTPHVLLGLLMSGPRHGYELYQELENNLGPVWRIGLSQLYLQLKQMEQAGLVASHAEAQANRPARKVYQITKEGREAFLSWLQQPTPGLRLLRVEFLLRLYLFHRLSLPGLEQLVTAQAAVCRTQADRFGQAAAEAGDSFLRLVYEFRLGQIEAAIHWLDRCLKLDCARLPASWEGEGKVSSPPGPTARQHGQGVTT